jgi:hypothetical protein
MNYHRTPTSVFRSLGYVMDYRRRFAVKSDGPGGLGRIDHNYNDDTLVAAHGGKRFVSIRPNSLRPNAGDCRLR